MTKKRTWTEKRSAVKLILFFAILLLGIGFASPNDVYADTIASGTCGTCDWTIDEDGVLTISAGQLADWGENPPWQQSPVSIKSVKTTGIVVLATGHRMFAGMSYLTEIDTSGFDTSKVTDMSEMFSGCYKVTDLDVSHFDTSKATNMSGMFSSCKMHNLDLSGFDTSKVTDMSRMFQSCGVAVLDISHFDTSKVTDMNGMFWDYYEATSLDVSNFKTSEVTDMGVMFSGCSNLMSLDVSHFDTSKVTSMAEMFNECEGLTSLDVSRFNTSNVIYMDNMFGQCKSLTTLDVSNFYTGNVESMGFMFSGCSSLIELDVSNFDTKKVKFLGGLFFHCNSLRSLDLRRFDTSEAIWMNDMFNGCSSLKNLDVSHFITTNAKTMEGMFYGCSSLTSLDISGFSVEAIEGWRDGGISNVFGGVKGMFDGCESLSKIMIGKWDITVWSDTVVRPTIPVTMRDMSTNIVYEKGSTIPAVDYHTFEKVTECFEGHNFSAWETITSSTCVTPGLQQRTCQTCGAIESKELNPSGHIWDEGVITTEPTYMEAGVKTFICTVCNETRTEVVPILEPEVGSIIQIDGATYIVTSRSTVALAKAGNTRNVTIPASVTIGADTYKVTTIKTNAFKGTKATSVTAGKNIIKIEQKAFRESKVKTLTVKSKKLKKNSVKGSLKNSKVKTVRVKVGDKKTNKKYVKKYKKIFTKKNAGKKVAVK